MSTAQDSCRNDELQLCTSLLISDYDQTSTCVYYEPVPSGRSTLFPNVPFGYGGDIFPEEGYWFWKCGNSNEESRWDDGDGNGAYNMCVNYDGNSITWSTPNLSEGTPTCSSS